jgi:hypothetical protein
VDLSYLLHVGDVFLGRAAHRRAKGPHVEAGAVVLLVGEVDDQRTDVRVVLIAV